MILIATRDATLARELHEALSGEKIYAFSVGQLRRLAGGTHPEIVVLDARLGHNEHRAIEEIPDLTTWTHGCSVVVVSPSKGARELREARELGAYGFVSLVDAAWLTKLRQITSTALRAIRRRSSSLRGPVVH